VIKHISTPSRTAFRRAYLFLQFAAFDYVAEYCKRLQTFRCRRKLKHCAAVLKTKVAIFINIGKVQQ